MYFAVEYFTCMITIRSLEGSRRSVKTEIYRFFSKIEHQPQTILNL